MKNIINIFQNRNYSLLFFASFTSQMGNIIGIAAFMLYLLDRFSEQPAYAAVTEMMYSLPTLAVFFLVGVFADKLDRQKIAMYTDFICSGFSFALIGAIYLDFMPLIFALLFLRSAVSKFFYPAQGAMIQGILTKETYTIAAGLNQMTSSLFMLFGNALGIFIYWTVGLQGAIIVDAVGYIISGLLIRACLIKEEVRLPNGKHTIKDINVKSVLTDFKKGMYYIMKFPLLLNIIVGFFVFGIVNGGLSVMPAYILKYKLAPDSYEQIMVYFGIVFGISVLVGSLIASVISKKIKLYQMIIIGCFITAIFITLTGYTSTLLPYFILNAIVGLSLPFINIGIGGWLPSIVDPKMMGRVQGWITPLMMLSQSITLGVIALTFQKTLTIEGLYTLVGCCILFVAVYYTFLLPKYAGEESENVIEKSTTM